MRELKFKIYDKNDTKGIIGPFTWNKLPQFLFPENFTVLQYTGMIDRNGVEMYEGDIVEYNPDEPIFRIGIIEYSDYYNGWSIRDKNCYPASEYGQYSLASPFLSFNTVKIIGNIFENSELLN